MTNVNADGSVTFRFYRPTAGQVKLVGDFTNWQQAPIDMTCTGDGWWTLGTKLNGGEYRFRYLADGQWYTDFAAYGIEATESGWNSVLVVPEQAMN